MSRPNVNDLLAFLAVARERSFTRAAARLGVSQSALSHTVRGLEERLGLRLLARTTRSVTPTEAGERLLNSIAPRFEEIEAEIAALGALREKPAGNIRIIAGEHPVATIIWPKLAPFLADYPDIKLEILADCGAGDIVAAGRWDAGVGLGETLEKDMAAVRIGPDMRAAVVGAPSYFERRSKPETPQDLISHNCINFHLPSSGEIYAWEFEKDGQALRAHVSGQLAFDSVALRLEAALSGMGLAFLPEDLALSPINDGRLTRVLEDWCPVCPGYYLYYPSRRQNSPAFALLVERLRAAA